MKSALREAPETIRVGLDRGDPALRQVPGWLGAGFTAGPDDDCDVRVVGPAELAGLGPRALELRARLQPLVLLVSELPGREFLRECFRAGVRDVVALAEAPHCLAPALRRVLARASQESALQQLEQSYEQTLQALVSALDLREQETADHSLRVALHALRLALCLRVPEDSLRDLYHGALLHDIGKIGIPDEVLLKPGALTEDEWRVMRTHARLGGEMLGGISFLSPARDVPLCHHEAWDGSGYPAGLAGAEIPLHARIFAVVDTYDALRSERPYKSAHSHAQAVALLRQAAGARLDPEIVERFAAEPAECWDRLAASAAGQCGFAGAWAAARASLR